MLHVNLYRLALNALPICFFLLQFLAAPPHTLPFSTDLYCDSSFSNYCYVVLIIILLLFSAGSCPLKHKIPSYFKLFPNGGMAVLPLLSSLSAPFNTTLGNKTELIKSNNIWRQ